MVSLAMILSCRRLGRGSGHVPWLNVMGPLRYSTTFVQMLGSAKQATSVCLSPI